MLADGRPARERAAEQRRIEEIRRQLRFQPEERNSRPEETNRNALRVIQIEMGENDYQDAFQKREIRHQFIKFVYMILCSQIFLTGGIAFFFKQFEPAHDWLMGLGFSALIGIVIGILVLSIIISCCENVRKTFPINFFMLFIFTFLYGLLFSYIVVHHPNDAVLLALGCTSAVVIGLTIFACQTKCDFTVCYGLLFVSLIVVLFMGIASIFIHNRTYQIVYASFGTILFSLYLIFDTQMIVGGKTKFQIAPDEYILGALNLYMDIMLIFLYILQLIDLS